MKLRNKWEGITLELVSKANTPLVLNQHFEGPTQELKVLIHDEQISIENVTVKIGGFEYEVELTAEEAIQNIKNITEICRVIREEITNFIDFGVTTKAKIQNIIKAVAAISTEETTEEPAPVVKDIGTQIKEGLAAALAGFNISKS